MKPYEKSWQGVGISSAAMKTRDPISVSMLAYLVEAARISDQHKVIVGDSMQRHNYVALRGLSEKRAKKLANWKGKRKARDLRNAAKALGIDNIEVLRFSEMQSELEPIREALIEIYNNEPEFRKRVIETIPKNLIAKMRSDGIDRLAQYTIDELTLALSQEGTRISHPRQIRVDELTSIVHADYNFGKKPEFYYPELGLEVVLSDRVSRLEPYSATRPEKRLLATDSEEQFATKTANASSKAIQTFLSHISSVWPVTKEGMSQFYQEHIQPVFVEVVVLPKFRRDVALASLTVSMFVTALATFDENKGFFPEAKQYYLSHTEDEFVVRYGKLGMDMMPGMMWGEEKRGIEEAKRLNNLDF